MNFIFINVTNKLSASSNAIPISMGYILEYLRRSGHDGIIIDDTYDNHLSLWSLENWIQRLKPQAIGFSAYQNNMERIRIFCRYIKLYHKEIKILLGGPQATFMPSNALSELTDVDIISRGEGEIVTSAIAECIKNDSSLSSVENITYRDNERIVDSPRSFDRTTDLDKFPSPYLGGTINLGGKEEAMVFTSRGCRYSCLFCISPLASGRKIRYHSISRVLDEMQYLERKGIRRFWIGDPIFPESIERDMQLLQGKIDRGIQTPFWCESRADNLNEQVLDKLVEANCDTVAIGLESADPAVLRRVAKGIKIDSLSHIVEIARSKGLMVELFSMFGLPGETVESALHTLNFVRQSMIPIQVNSEAQRLQLYFGSVYERYKERFGFKPLSQYYLPAYLSIGEGYETPALTSIEFQKIQRIWTLASVAMFQNAHNRELLFDVLNFLLEGENDLQDEEAFYEYGALASAALEESALLLKFLNGYASRLNPSESRLSSLISELGIYKESNGPVAPTSRVILDLRLDGSPCPSMKEGYLDVALGKNLFPSSFENGLIGTSAGSVKTFDFASPSTNRPDARAKAFVRIFKVLNPVEIRTLEELRSVSIRNHYCLPDIDRLYQNDKLMHYLVLRDIPEKSLATMPLHFLAQVHNYTRLHNFSALQRLKKLVSKDKRACESIGDTMYSCGRYQDAVACFDASKVEGSDRVVIKEARALLYQEDVGRALELLQTSSDKDTLDYSELLLDCLKTKPSSRQEIISLDQKVLNLRVASALDAETGKNLPEPIVHGSFRSKVMMA